MKKNRDTALRYEFNWLCVKLQMRSPLKYQELIYVKKIECRPIFELTEGEIEELEKVKPNLS